LLRGQEDVGARLEPDLCPLQREQLADAAARFDCGLNEQPQVWLARAEQPFLFAWLEAPAPTSFLGQLHDGFGPALERRLLDVPHADRPVEDGAQEGEMPVCSDDATGHARDFLFGSAD